MVCGTADAGAGEGARIASMIASNSPKLSYSNPFGTFSPLLSSVVCRNNFPDIAGIHFIPL